MRKIYVPMLWILLFLPVVFAQEAAKLSFTSTDKANNPVLDLQKEEIALLIDGKQQVVTSLEKQEAPLIYALAVDCSGSMRPIMGDLTRTAKAIVNQNRKDDETMLIRFISNDNITGMKTFSSDKNILNQIIEGFYIEGGQTALVDALYAAVKAAAGQKKDENEKYRRAVVVITDGEDRASLYNEKQLLELIEKENVQVFFIGLVNELGTGAGFINSVSPREKAKSFIEKIAGASGGAAIFPKKISDLPASVSQLTPLLQSQYVITYAAASDAKGKSSQIEIKLAKDSKRKDVKFNFRSANK
jgi:VWFA-related protein